MEPLPKQGCEGNCIQFNDDDGPSLSGTPAEAGVRVLLYFLLSPSVLVSVEPLPKQGCEEALPPCASDSRCLSGTPAEAGVRVAKIKSFFMAMRRLSGTPAEAGVRASNSCR